MAFVQDYTVQDEFTTSLSAGAVSGTACEPGPGTRTVTADTGGKITIAGGRLTLASNTTTADPQVLLTSIARAAGRLLLAEFTHGASVFGVIGFRANTTVNNTVENTIYPNGASLLIRETSNGITVGALTVSTSYKIAIALRATGAYYFIKGGAFTNWTLIWVSSVNGNATLYPCMIHGSGANAFSSDFIRVIPNGLLWLPIPLASDGFGGTFGTTDGLGHAETSGIGAGGSGVTWTQQAGTWGNSAGKAAASALSGGLAIATVDVGTANVFVMMTPARTAANAGLTLRYVDANNHIRVYIDGTNAKVDDVVAGVVTNRISAVATQNSLICVDLSGANVRLYVNNVLTGSSSAIANTTGTAHGLYTTDTGATFDNLAIYPKGTNGEHNALNWLGTMQVDGALTPVGDVSKLIARALAGALTFAGIVAKQTRRALSGALSTAGTLSSSLIKIMIIAGTLVTSGALTKQTRRVLAGTLTTAGAVVKQTRRILAGALSTAGALGKQTQRILVGALSATGTLAKQTQRVLAGTLTTAGALIKQIRRILAVTLTTAGNVAKQTRRALTGALTTAGALTVSFVAGIQIIVRSIRLQGVFSVIRNLFGSIGGDDD